MLNVAVIGCGEVATTEHIPSLLANPSTKLVSVCDLDITRAKQVSMDFNIPSFYQNPSEMLNKEMPDLVHVCTPPKTHFEIAMLALETGCHVLLEKPFVLKLDDADQLIMKAKKMNRKLSVVHNYLFFPVMLKAKEKVFQGEIGKVISVQALWGRKTDYYRDWFSDLPGGWFGEIIPHLLYLILAFTGDVEVKATTTMKVNKESYQPFDELQAELEGEKVLGFFSLTANCLRSNILILSGTKATLFIDVENNMLHKIPISPTGYLSKPFREISYFASSRLRKTLRRLNHPMYKGIVNSSHYYQINAFVESIEKDQEPPVTPEEARNVVKAYQKIWDAVYTEK